MLKNKGLLDFRRYYSNQNASVNTYLNHSIVVISSQIRVSKKAQIQDILS